MRGCCRPVVHSLKNAAPRQAECSTQAGERGRRADADGLGDERGQERARGATRRVRFAGLRRSSGSEPSTAITTGAVGVPILVFLRRDGTQRTGQEV